MNFPIPVDIRNVIGGLDQEGLKTLCFELVEAVGHRQECDALHLGDEMSDGTRLVTGTDKPCSCGADQRVARAFDQTLKIHKRTLGVLAP